MQSEILLHQRKGGKVQYWRAVWDVFAWGGPPVLEFYTSEGPHIAIRASASRRVQRMSPISGLRAWHHPAPPRLSPPACLRTSRHQPLSSTLAHRRRCQCQLLLLAVQLPIKRSHWTYAIALRAAAGSPIRSRATDFPTPVCI